MVYSLSDNMTSIYHFEVDSTESIWYTSTRSSTTGTPILKLTPQSQYGIRCRVADVPLLPILKLTPQSQYGIEFAKTLGIED